MMVYLFWAFVSFAVPVVLVGILCLLLCLAGWAWSHLARLAKGLSSRLYAWRWRRWVRRVCRDFRSSASCDGCVRARVRRRIARSRRRGVRWA